MHKSLRSKRPSPALQGWVRTRAEFQRLEKRLLFATYGPDVSFGDGGFANAQGQFVIIPQSDGKIFTVGTQTFSAGSGPDPGIRGTTFSYRLNADGTLDTTYSDDGKALFGDSHAVSYDGTRLYMTGEGSSAAIEGADEIRVYLADGTPDLTFSGDGVEPIPSTEEGSGELISLIATATVPQPDGRLFISYNVRYGDPVGNDSIFDQAVMLKHDGSIDTSWGDNGFFDGLTPDAPDYVLHLTPHGLYVLSRLGTEPTVRRYTPDGKALDDTFGDHGALTLPAFPDSLIEQADGKILYSASWIANGVQQPLRVFRLNQDGSPDTSFGTNGAVTLGMPDITRSSAGIFLDDQQRIVAVGLKTIFRFSPAGVLDAAPFNGTVPVIGGNFAFDLQGRLLVSFGTQIERFDTLAPLEIGRNHVAYVEGSDAADHVTVDAAPNNKIAVSLNNNATSLDAADVVGIAIHLDNGNNSAAVSVDLPITVRAGNGADTITTGKGNDSIDSGVGDNVIDCGDGNDTVNLGSEDESTSVDNDTITGGNGDKTISSHSGLAGVHVTLGVGNSTVFNLFTPDAHVSIAGGSNNVEIAGGTVNIDGSGNNNVSNFSNACTITTGDGNDTIGDDGSGLIHSNGGNDSISIGAADVTVFAGDGNDHIDASEFGVTSFTAYGENGNDEMTAFAGSQSLYGGAGKDTLRGGSGSDLLSGGGGNDQLFGETGNDRLYGGDGRDQLFGGRGDDRLFGGASGDWLYGQGGNDQLNGDGGNDRLYADYNGASTLHGGAGDDLLVARDSTSDHLFGDGGRDTAIADQHDLLTGIE